MKLSENVKNPSFNVTFATMKLTLSLASSQQHEMLYLAKNNNKKNIQERTKTFPQKF